MKTSNSDINYNIQVNDDRLDHLIQDRAGFEKLSQMLKSLAGIDLPPSSKNLSLMASRLRRVLVSNNLPNYQEYINYLSKNGSPAIQEFISALTTNTTNFFREKEHFEYFRQWLPGLMAQRKAEGASDFRIWCAASSTGQEPYTILMTYLETFDKLYSLPLKMLATDIDDQVLSRAAHAVYRGAEINGVPSKELGKYFDSRMDQLGEPLFRVKKQYRQMISFAKLNLLQDIPKIKNNFDVIFCRNVLIYFDLPTTSVVVENLISKLKPDGLFFVGHSESGVSKSPLLKSLQPAAYQKIGSEKKMKVG